MSDPFAVFELQIKEEQNQIKRLKELCQRAAIALEKESWPSAHHDYSALIAELREAKAAIKL